MDNALTNLLVEMNKSKQNTGSLEDIKNIHPKIAELYHIEVLRQDRAAREKKIARLKRWDADLTRVYFQTMDSIKEWESWPTK